MNLTRLGRIWLAAGVLSFPCGLVGLIQAPANVRSVDAWFLTLFSIAVLLTVLFGLPGALAMFGARSAAKVGVIANCVSLLLGLVVTLFGALASAWIVAIWGVATLTLAGYSLNGLSAYFQSRRATSPIDVIRARIRPGALRIFVSYRRSDSAELTDRLCEHLTDAFSKEYVFRDIDSIPLGVDFRTHVDAAIARCNVVLVVIGPQWIDCRDDRNQLRLLDPADAVRLEIEAGLNRGLRVIPLLLNKTSMPKADQLPESIRQLAFANGQSIRPDPDFRHDLERLLEQLAAISVPQAL